mmetsp:Transcript_97614/g.244628  ORF Transcript_97614/g.244628 Transcript_97614/m.244628 type:complete len:520 (+) Transcript_97614:137-1696(+)
MDRTPLNKNESEDESPDFKETSSKAFSAEDITDPRSRCSSCVSVRFRVLLISSLFAMVGLLVFRGDEKRGVFLRSHTPAIQLDAFSDAAENGLFDEGMCGDIQPAIVTHVMSKVGDPRFQGTQDGAPKNFVGTHKRSLSKWLLEVPLSSSTSIRAYSTLDITPGSGPWPEVETVVIGVHGALRNADEYLCFLTKGARGSAEHATAASRLMVLTPWFEWSGSETPEAIGNGSYIQNFKSFSSGDHGRWGDHASSLSALDVLVDTLRAKAVIDGQLPNLRSVVLTGHSAGATLVMLHAVGTQLPGVSNGVAVRWVPANPRRYPYLDRRRWAYTDADGPFKLADPLNETETPRFYCQSGSYNEWPKGLAPAKKYTPPGVDLESESNRAEIVRRFAERDVTVVLGTNDTCNCALHPGPCVADPHHGWPKLVLHHVCLGRNWSASDIDDNSVSSSLTVTADFHFICDNLLQGPTRFQRGKLFQQYLLDLYGRETAKFVEVPGIGHVDMWMFRSREFLNAIFQQH